MTGKASELINGNLGKIMLLLVGSALGGGGSILGAHYVGTGDVPTRSEVREMVTVAIGPVKESQGLDRNSMLEWKADQKATLEGIRTDVKALEHQQTETNVLLKMLVKATP